MMGPFSGLNKGEISVISSKKVEPLKLCATGDSEPQDTPEALKRAEIVRAKLGNAKGSSGNTSDTGASTQEPVAKPKDAKCTLCCAAFSALLAIPTCTLVAASHTVVCIMMEKKVNYTLNSIARQITWITVPGVLSAMTLHGHVSEAMWSARRNSWGQAWAKAVVVNVMMWCSAVALCTCAWRYLLPRFDWGRKLHRLYPVPCLSLETRMIVDPTHWIQGMGWTYWLLAVLIGNAGFAFVAGFAWYYDRVHFIMSPNGPYARRCVPTFRRKQIARDAHVPFEE